MTKEIWKTAIQFASSFMRKGKHNHSCLHATDSFELSLFLSKVSFRKERFHEREQRVLCWNVFFSFLFHFFFQLLRLKTDLHDLLHSHKWTPEAFLLAKAYASGNDVETPHRQSGKQRASFPPVQRGFSTTLRPHDELSLPALRPTVGQKAVRQKNVQAVQKARQQRLLS